MLVIYALVGGLSLIAAGILLWAKADPISRSANDSYEYFLPEAFKKAFRRNSLRGIRIAASLWIAIGVGIVTYYLAREV